MNESKKRLIAYAPIRDIMKNTGASMVSKEAVEYMIDAIVDFVKKTTATTLKIIRSNKPPRTKITREDLDLVLKKI